MQKKLSKFSIDQISFEIPYVFQEKSVTTFNFCTLILRPT